MRRRVWIAALLAPAAFIMVVFMAAPMAAAFLGAFRSFNGAAASGWVGLANFAAILSAPVTYGALLHNLFVFAALMVLQNGAAFLVAYALLQGLPGHAVHRVIVFLPVVLSAVVVGFLWKLLLHPLFGAVNAVLVGVGLPAVAWLGEAGTALPSLVVVNAWHWLGFPALVLLAGMQRIPREVLEAARLDGAGDGVLLRHVIWPLVAPAVTIVTVLTFVGAMNWFELPYVMTGVNGSPGGATDVLGLYFYRTAFGGVTSGLQDFGRGSALAVVMVVLVSTVSGLGLRQLRRRETEL